MSDRQILVSERDLALLILWATYGAMRAANMNHVFKPRDAEIRELRECVDRVVDRFGAPDGQ